jgi:hypothetical protein
MASTDCIDQLFALVDQDNNGYEANERSSGVAPAAVLYSNPQHMLLSRLHVLFASSAHDTHPASPAADASAEYWTLAR